MAGSATGQSHATVGSGVWSYAVVACVKLLFWIVTSVVGAGCIAIAASIYVATDSAQEFNSELARKTFDAASIELDRAGGSKLLTASAQALSDLYYTLFFKATGLHEAMERFAQDAPVNQVDSWYRNKIIVPYDSQIRSAMYAVQTVGLRMTQAAAAVFLLSVACAIGLNDGLTQRNLRTNCAGRESAFLYHRAKFCLFAVSSGLFSLFIVWPYPIHSALWVGCLAALWVTATRVQYTFYKKYL